MTRVKQATSLVSLEVAGALLLRKKLNGFLRLRPMQVCQGTHRCFLGHAEMPSKEDLKISENLEEFAHTITHPFGMRPDFIGSLWYAKSSFNAINQWMPKRFKLLGWTVAFWMISSLSYRRLSASEWMGEQISADGMAQNEYFEW